MIKFYDSLLNSFSLVDYGFTFEEVYLYTMRVNTLGAESFENRDFLGINIATHKILQMGKNNFHE